MTVLEDNYVSREFSSTAIDFLFPKQNWNLKLFEAEAAAAGQHLGPRMRGLPQHSACCYGIDPGMSLHAFDFRKARIEDLSCGGSLLVTWYVNLLLSMSLPANSEFRSVYARSASASGMLLWHRPWPWY